MEFDNFFTEACLLEYELDKEMSKLRAVAKQEARFGKHLPTSVAEVANFIYPQGVETSTEGFAGNVASGIMKVIKKIFKAIADMIRRFHAFVMKQNGAQKKTMTVINNVDTTDPAKVAKIKTFVNILPKETFSSYMLALSEIRQGITSNSLLSAHTDGTANKSTVHDALLRFGFGFSDMIDIYRHNKSGQRSVNVETPESFINAIRTRLMIKSDKGEWKIDEVKHFMSQMIRANTADESLDHRKVSMQLDNYIKNAENAINNGDIEGDDGYEAISIASKWMMVVFKVHTITSQALNTQINAAAKTILGK